MLPLALLLPLLSLRVIATPTPRSADSPFPLIDERDSQAGIAFSERAFDLEKPNEGLAERDGATGVSFFDISLPFLYPTEGVVFQAGGIGTISWNATLPTGIDPSQAQPTAKLVLGYTADGVLGYNLDLDNPLVPAVPLFVAPYSINFTFPANLTTRTTYVMALLGSSGNLSPLFTIEAVGDVVSSSSSEAAPVATGSPTTFNPYSISTYSASAFVASTTSPIFVASASASTATATDGDATSLPLSTSTASSPPSEDTALPPSLSMESSVPTTAPTTRTASVVSAITTISGALAQASQGVSTKSSAGAGLQPAAFFSSIVVVVLVFVLV